MLPKAAAIDAAIKNGVSRVHVISHKLPDSILLEVFTNEGTGTLVVDDVNALTPEEQAAEVMSRLWEKGLPLDERVLRYTAGEDHLLDGRLVEYDVRGSIAHAEMLAAQALITRDDCHAICEGLRALEKSFDAGEWQITLEDEDVHTALESRLTAEHRRGRRPPAPRRSRNDQVLTALRLYLRDAALDLAGRVEHLRGAIAHVAERQGESRVARLHAHAARHALVRRALVRRFSMKASVTPSPDCAPSTGESTRTPSAARPATVRRVCRSIASSRRSVSVSTRRSHRSRPRSCRAARPKAPCCSRIALMMQDLSRMASDLLLFYTQEFAYVSLAAEVTTGSSIMPQKRNPDVLELLRASSATALACLDEALMITAKLPSGYHRDLQRLKSPLFRSIDLAVESVDIMAYCSRVLNSSQRISSSTRASSQRPKPTVS